MAVPSGERSRAGYYGRNKHAVTRHLRWAGLAAALGRALPAGEVTRKLAADALALLRRG